MRNSQNYVQNSVTNCIHLLKMSLKRMRLFIPRFPRPTANGLRMFNFYLWFLPARCAFLRARGCVWVYSTGLRSARHAFFFYPWEDGTFSEEASRLFSERSLLFPPSNNIIVTSNSERELEFKFRRITWRDYFFFVRLTVSELWSISDDQIFFYIRRVTNEDVCICTVSEVTQSSAR